MREIYGYARVSSKDQNEERQLIALSEYGVSTHNVFVDKLSGKDFNRPMYYKLVRKTLKKDDLLVIQSIDRLGRNYEEILEEWRYITKEMRADIKVLDIQLLDTTINKDLMGTFISDIVLQLLSFVAHNERDTIRKRQSEGIAAAKVRGVAFGRPKKPFSDEFVTAYLAWRGGEITAQEAGQKVCLTQRQFYKQVERYEKSYGK